MPNSWVRSAYEMLKKRDYVHVGTDEAFETYKKESLIDADIENVYKTIEYCMKKPDLLGKTLLVSERQFSKVNSMVLELCDFMEMSKPDIYVFEDIVYVDNKNNDNKPNIMDKPDNVVIEEGVVAIINSDAQKIDVSNIRINNKSSNKVKIRVVFENSDKTTLQNTFFKDVKYKISAENVEKSINSNPWDNNEKEYILYETELASKEEVEYQIGIWLDYEGLDNSAMGKSFYGTLKVYSWQQK